MKKGFTLVELLVVIVIIVIVSVIGYAGVTVVHDNVKENLWEGQVDLIESGAQMYGEDNKNRLVNTCNVDGGVKNNCLIVTVDYLIETNYVPTEETDSSGREVIINETLEEDDPNYYVNDMEVSIYMENNIVYAKLNR